MAWSDTKGDWSQRDQRRDAILTDQHGRKYGAVIEKRTGDDIQMFPKGWSAPLAVPATYMEKHPSEERPLDRVINYARWEEDARRAIAEWEKEGRTRARQTPGIGQNEDGTFTQVVLDVIGPRPMDVEPIIAARQGNGYVLGTRPFDPKRATDRKLRDYFVEREEEAKRITEPDFSDDDEFMDELDETSEQRLAREIDALEDEADPDAVGGKTVPAGRTPGRAPRERTTKHPTEQARGVRRSGAQAPEKGVATKKRSHKRRVTAEVIPPSGPVQEPVTV